MFKLELPYPISVNRYWKFWRNQPRVSKEARAYKIAVAAIAIEHGVTVIDGDVAIAFVLHPKMTKGGVASRTRMDLDNAQKVAIDALNGVAYIDDKQIVDIRMTLGAAMQGGGLSVWVGKK